jgi:hypothetical protein
MSPIATRAFVMSTCRQELRTVVQSGSPLLFCSLLTHQASSHLRPRRLRASVSITQSQTFGLLTYPFKRYQMDEPLTHTHAEMTPLHHTTSIVSEPPATSLLDLPNELLIIVPTNGYDVRIVASGAGHWPSSLYQASPLLSSNTMNLVFGGNRSARAHLSSTIERVVALCDSSLEDV